MGSSRKLVASVLVVLLMLTSSVTYGQTWGEIFRQKKTQKEYLLKQIAALQVYIGYAKKGYDIVGDGVHLVKDVTSGEFSLHKSFFASLSLVNPSIKGSVAVSEILDRGLSVIWVLKSWKPSGLNANDWGYVSLVKANLLAECATELEELLMVITSGRLEMKDDERLGRLERLRLSMEDKYGFALSFSGDLDRLFKQREREQHNINEIRRWHEIE
ncbi:hypothetical protein [Pedobacter psychroterrae]|uniref:Uncharacterized protein n=1 Tax=Pedobacter psychroterrae TaxID=2530453 RepID=A0A4R0NQ58_9SPHI|nr:hypothetical protein [Pedobacter psychroterrae]TCD03170.1 hypothetical protein EZ437_04135 [Pedobacter psychroterrae]